jgi:hypothetical protein
MTSLPPATVVASIVAAAAAATAFVVMRTGGPHEHEAIVSAPKDPDTRPLQAMAHRAASVPAAIAATLSPPAPSPLAAAAAAIPAHFSTLPKRSLISTDGPIAAVTLQDLHCPEPKPTRKTSGPARPVKAWLKAPPASDSFLEEYMDMPF